MQVSRYVGVTQKTAWFMLQRIRFAIEKGELGEKLSLVVEADETYIGGKRRGSKRGRGAEHKTPVVGLVQRQGGVVTRAVEDTTARTVKKIIRENVKIGSIVLTDEYPSYNTIVKDGYSHIFVNHSKEEYVNGDIHVNTIEGFWSQLKRGIDGIYHHVSRKHLNKYCKEYEYRYNTRAMPDFLRFTNTLNLLNVRLLYSQLTLCKI